MSAYALARTQHDVAHRALCPSGSCVVGQFGSRLCRAKSVIGPPACARLVSLRMSPSGAKGLVRFGRLCPNATAKLRSMIPSFFMRCSTAPAESRASRTSRFNDCGDQLLGGAPPPMRRRMASKCRRDLDYVGGRLQPHVEERFGVTPGTSGAFGQHNLLVWLLWFARLLIEGRRTGTQVIERSPSHCAPLPTKLRHIVSQLFTIGAVFP